MPTLNLLKIPKILQYLNFICNKSLKNLKKSIDTKYNKSNY